MGITLTIVDSYRHVCHDPHSYVVWGQRVYDDSSVRADVALVDCKDRKEVAGDMPLSLSLLSTGGLFKVSTYFWISSLGIALVNYPSALLPLLHLLSLLWLFESAAAATRSYSSLLKTLSLLSHSLQIPYF